MSKTPLFCKESTPQNILIPHVDDKILSCLLATGGSGGGSRVAWPCPRAHPAAAGADRRSVEVDSGFRRPRPAGSQDAMLVPECDCCLRRGAKAARVCVCSAEC